MLDDLPGARSLALVGHSIELDEELLALDAVSAVAMVGPRTPIATPPITRARAAPGKVICIFHLQLCSGLVATTSEAAKGFTTGRTTVQVSAELQHGRLALAATLAVAIALVPPRVGKWWQP